MKKKLLQEQREKAIIESFAKTFNKIKRLDENEIQLNEFGGYGFKEPNPEDIEFVVANRNTPAFKQAFSPLERLDMEGLNDDELRLHIKATVDKDDLEDARLYMKQLMQQGDYGAPKSEELDEINLGKGLATLGLAATMMGAPKDASAQTQMPQQGIEKSVSSASAMGLPEDNRKAGKVVMNSYTKNPFTADMWSKKSRDNFRFFKTIKKLVDYYMGGGQIEDSDLEQLGAMAKQSPVAMEFLQRQ